MTTIYRPFALTIWIALFFAIVYGSDFAWGWFVGGLVAGFIVTVKR